MSSSETSPSHPVLGGSAPRPLPGGSSAKSVSAVPSPSRPVPGGSSARSSSSRPQILRAPWHDYRQPGVYMLTLCTHDRRPLLGSLYADEAGVGRVRPSHLGSSLAQALQQLPLIYEELEVMRYVVMPDHFHVVVQIHQPMQRHLGEMVRRLKYTTTVAYLKELDLREGCFHRVEGSRPSRREREAVKGKAPEDEPQATERPVVLVPPLWQDNYHDRILTHYGQLPKMLHYVEDNPHRAWTKRQHRQFFYDKQTLHIPIPVELARALYREARALAELPALESFLIVDRTGEEVKTSLRMRAMGNPFLLDEGLHLPLRVSRSVSREDYTTLHDQLLQRCADEGAVIVTPCVSNGEQMLVDDALQNGFRVIRLQHEGMSDLYSPSERFLPFTASGQMLFLAPWPDQPLSVHPTKGRFEFLNTLARILCGLNP